MDYQGIIFDLDGTLADTLADLTDAMNAGLADLGCPQRTAEECRQMIGNGLRKFAERALGPGREELTDKLVAAQIAHYMRCCCEKTQVYDGMAETVTELADRGVRLAVLTNKDQKPAEIITRHYFGNRFDPIVGAANGRKRKPNPATTFEILKQWNLTAEQVLFVGDSEPDMQTATAAGVRAVGCEWGFRSREILTGAGADTVIEQPKQILKLINRE